MKNKILPVLAILSVFFLISSITALILTLSDGTKTGNIAHIKIHGPIFVSKSPQMFGTTIASPENIVKFINKAEEDPNIQAILLDINSPGGSAVASEEISQAIMNANKTTVAVIREMGTSGAFWVATSADFVFASRASLTGSIGVISSYLEFSGLMKDYNVNYERLVAGSRKDAGSPYRPLREDEREKFQLQLDKIHEFFISHVAESRGLDTAKVRNVSDGMFFLGTEAKEWGLIDEIGTMHDAIRYIESQKAIKADLVEYKKKIGLFDLLPSVAKEMAVGIGEGMGSVLHQSPVIQ